MRLFRLDSSWWHRCCSYSYRVSSSLKFRSNTSHLSCSISKATDFYVYMAAKLFRYSKYILAFSVSIMAVRDLSFSSASNRLNCYSNSRLLLPSNSALFRNVQTYLSRPAYFFASSYRTFNDICSWMFSFIREFSSFADASLLFSSFVCSSLRWLCVLSSSYFNFPIVVKC